MPSQPSSAARCLDALLRYELAAVNCYRYAERVLPADREALAAVRRTHEFAAAALAQRLSLLSQGPPTGPGLWGVLGTLVEAAACSARWAVLTALVWGERHGVETYESACRIPCLAPADCALIESTLVPALHENVRGLGQLLAAPTASRLA